MARIRTIKPEMAQDEDLATVSIEAQLLAVRILNQADDEGYFNANPLLIKASCFPLIDSVNIPVLLRELSEIGYIQTFSGSDGKTYGYLPTFTKHQVINKPKDSKIKDLVGVPDEYGSDTVAVPVGKEGKGTGKGKEDTSKPAVSPCPHISIIDIYHETLPELPKVLPSRWAGSASENQLKARWRENEAHRDLDWWRGYFQSVRASDWWMGRESKWKADLHWLVKRSNFDKVVQAWANAA